MAKKEKNIVEGSTEEIEYIYTPYITKNGARIYAKQFGKKVFKIPKSN